MRVIWLVMASTCLLSVFYAAFRGPLFSDFCAFCKGLEERASKPKQITREVVAKLVILAMCLPKFWLATAKPTSTNLIVILGQVLV